MIAVLVKQGYVRLFQEPSHCTLKICALYYLDHLQLLENKLGLSIFDRMDYLPLKKGEEMNEFELPPTSLCLA